MSLESEVLDAFSNLAKNKSFTNLRLEFEDTDPTINLSLENNTVKFNKSCLIIPVFRNIAEKCGFEKFLGYSILTEQLKQKLGDAKKAQLEIIKNHPEYHSVLMVATGYSKRKLKLACRRAKMC